MKLFLLSLVFMFLVSGCSQPEKQNITRQAVETTAPECIGMFITDIVDTHPDRVENLIICADSIDRHKVMPGEEFSFNRIVGERTTDKGYNNAKIIIDGERGYAVGGGICQISSTLLGAVKSAGLTVTERHSHEAEVGYVKQGEDAAISYSTQDFKFINTLDTPVTIHIEVADTQVKAELYR
ncbi:MAG: VanW family protein [Clostridia bacterium]|nr:VanW family protein [Clostridia bacterium]